MSMQLLCHVLLNQSLALLRGVRHECAGRGREGQTGQKCSVVQEPSQFGRRCEMRSHSSNVQA